MDERRVAQKKAITQEKKEMLKLLEKAWRPLAYRLNNIRWEPIADNYLKENMQEERAHDRYRGDSITRGLTIREASLLFALKQIAGYFTKKEKAPNPANYLHIRKSVFSAYSIVETYREEIWESWKVLNRKELTTLVNLDYCLYI